MNGCDGCSGCLDIGASDGAPAGCGGSCAGACSCDEGCGAAVAGLTPRTLFNRPGLSAVDYRTGTYRDLFDSMLARLATRPELGALTTRSLDDPAIALLDCWAVIGDVITFYAERVANEGYLGTATRAESLTCLARLVDYRGRPALGASGHLAFTMDPGSIGVIPAGSQARSVVSGPNELPQTFETDETIDARADWNALAVRLTRPAALSPETAADHDRIMLIGASVGLTVGLRVVFDYGGFHAADVRVVAAVTPDFAAGTTVVDLVPIEPTGPAAAIDVLAALIETAVSDVPVGTTGSVFETLRAYGPDQFNSDTGRGNVEDFNTVATLIRELTEAMALQAGHGSSAVSSWLKGPVRDILTQAQAALAVMADDQRRLAPDILYLQKLARALTCPPSTPDGAVGRKSTDPGCDRAAPLVGAAAILSALSRRPSRPPLNARALPRTTGTLLDPQCDAAPQLLEAIEPRLSGVLTTALGQQTVTAPAATADVVALRSKTTPLPDEVFLAVVAADENVFTVDGAPDTIVPGTWLVSEQLNADGSTSTYANRVVSVEHFSRTLPLPVGAPTASVATTRVTLSGPGYRMGAGSRAVDAITVYYAGTTLQLADEVISDDVGGGEIDLDRTYDGLAPGRRLIVTGERTDVPGTRGVMASELTMVGSVQQRLDTGLGGDSIRPTLVLATPLAYTYRRASVVISANVASATQGETRTEVLGSGAAGLAGQAFALKQVSTNAPLTWLPDSSALGADDTLAVRVDGLLWHESDDLTEADPTSREYRTTMAGDGTEKVVFGDGLHGARLPTGAENVSASYRVGAGESGNLGPDRIRQLASHPLGTDAVTNPLPTTGGSDADRPFDLRRRAPLRTLALDRLLSVTDYADFATARAGIGQAVATELSDGGVRLVHLTVAGVDDAPIDETDQLVLGLRTALAELGDPYLPVRVARRDLILLVLSAGIKVGPDDTFDRVEPLVRAAVLQVAGFDNRRLGEPVYLSELIAAVQAVPGVEYVDVDTFGALPGSIAPVPMLQTLLGLSGVDQVIDVRSARYDYLTHPVGIDPTGAVDTLTSIALRYGVTLADLARLNPSLTAVALVPGAPIVVFRGIRPAQLALLSPDVPATLILRSIP